MPSFEEVYGQSAATAASNPSQPSDPQSTTTTTTTDTQSAQSPPPSSLPPAAIDLAAKLFDLARTGTTPTLHAYISAGIPKNLTNASGDTLLMLASYHGHAETARMLLENGADANVLNARGQSPIAGAVFKGYDEVVRVLYEGGADVRLGQPNAVDCARMFKRGSCLKLFGEEEGEGTTIEVGK
ncbi:ankyrin repeat-containing domain protein [Paraphoma chrysanthemicola]|nr:ankyrin repeat-containing domain protein [Paraphoma chrysanthemicola]